MANSRTTNLQRNQGTTLLSPDENAEIFSMLREGCQSISATVAKMYTTINKFGTSWQYFGTGVLVLARDKAARSYFLQLVCPDRRKILWEHELYRHMRYCDARPFFYTFEGENYMVGFDFVSVDEAKLIEEAIHCKLETIEIAARKARQNAAQESKDFSKTREARKDSTTSNMSLFQDYVLREAGIRKKNKLFQKKKKERRIPEISEPTDFRHLTHVQSTDSILDLKRLLSSDITALETKRNVPPPNVPPPPKPGSPYSDPFVVTEHGPTPPKSAPLVIGRPKPKEEPVTPVPPPPPPPLSERPGNCSPPEYMLPMQVSPENSGGPANVPMFHPPAPQEDPRMALLEDIRNGAATLRPVRKKVSFSTGKPHAGTYAGRHRPSVLKKTRPGGMESIFHEAIKKIGEATQGSESEASGSDDEWDA